MYLTILVVCICYLFVQILITSMFNLCKYTWVRKGHLKSKHYLILAPFIILTSKFSHACINYKYMSSDINQLDVFVLLLIFMQYSSADNANILASRERNINQISVLFCTCTSTCMYVQCRFQRIRFV